MAPTPVFDENLLLDAMVMLCRTGSTVEEVEWFLTTTCNSHPNLVDMLRRALDEVDVANAVEGIPPLVDKGSN